MRITKVVAVRYDHRTDQFQPLGGTDRASQAEEARALAQALRRGEATLRHVWGYEPYTHHLQVVTVDFAHGDYLVRVAGKPTLSRNQFAAWLKHLREINPNTVVGAANAAGSCPVAQYLRDRGVLSPVVLFDSIADYSGVLCSTPEWTRRFIRRVDSRFDPRIPGSASVTAEQALQILRKRK